MSNDVLKKPVHYALVKPTSVEALSKQARFHKVEHAKELNQKFDLPQEEKDEPRKALKPKVPKGLRSNFKGAGMVRRVNRKVQLKAFWEHAVPPIPEDKEPPCSSCKASPCCSAFVVALTKEEYESGLYEPYTIKFTEEQVKQLKGATLLPVTVTSPVYNIQNAVEYYLEGRVGEPCPFLKDDNGCGIYDQRPLTCRTYTCVGDDRITQEMRDGTDAPVSEERLAVQAAIEFMSRDR